MAIHQELPPAAEHHRHQHIRLRDISETDHGWIARLHIDQLPHGLFPHLGPRFVQRWHRAHLASPYGRGIVATYGDTPVGFLLGSVDRPRHIEWIATHRRRELALAGSLALFMRPRLAVRFLRTRAAAYARRLLIHRPDHRPEMSAAHAPAVAPAVLEAIVVIANARANGVGRQLTDRFLEIAAEAGADHVELVTKEGPDGAADFYERNGWTRTRRHHDRDEIAFITFRTDLPKQANQ